MIDNPSGRPSEDNTVVFRAIWASLLTQKNKAAAEFVQKLLKEETVMLLQQKTKMKNLLIQVKSLALAGNTEAVLSHQASYSMTRQPRK